MPEQSSVGALIDVVGRQLTEEEPLYVTATRVFHDGVASLGEEQLTALEAVGFESVRINGAPSLVSLPAVVRMVEQRRPFDHDSISARDRPKLMLIGFLALAAETFRSEEDDA